MKPRLPDDILHLLCEELVERRDFGTLFSCCCVAKSLAMPALAGLYRGQHLSSIKSRDSDPTSLAEQDLVVQRWSIQWRSIVLSALDKTLLPYCRYLRVLDLGDLEMLFEESRFQPGGKIFNHLARYNIPMPTGPLVKTRSGKPRPPRLNFSAIFEAIADDIIPKAPNLERVDGPRSLAGTAFVRWLPSLSKLRFLKVFDGNVLDDCRIPSIIGNNCPKFESLSIFMWIGPKCDQNLAAILSAIPNDTLRSFATFSRTQFGSETCLALNNHGASLKVLELQLENAVVPQLGVLKDCTALESIKLTDAGGGIDLKTNNDAIAGIVSWLLSCHKLHTLTLHNFTSGAVLATPVLLSDRIRLEDLEIDSYTESDQDSFHRALLNQTSLQCLLLDGEEVQTRDSLDIFVHSIEQLKQLRSLKMVSVSNSFNDQHICGIAEQLENLEHLYIGGLGLQDVSLESMANLKNLQSVSFSGLTSFTMDGFLELIGRLGPGNKGLVLTVDNANPDDGLSEEEQTFVRNALIEAVDGRFEYIYMRDPNMSEFEGESD
ncbi:hypothetical protein FKW77_007479 [Venturia effusa]|uniref:F-box domain-containing protein n=1 Tax=Venturia effusa TaxID=50376 RepID=A0A517LJ53_9PEZI|nr:hypothetical protein FKW77_007479 [Venturia effusa]